MLVQGREVLELLEAVDKASMRSEKLWTLVEISKMRASIQHYARLHKKEEMELLEG